MLQTQDRFYVFNHYKWEKDERISEAANSRLGNCRSEGQLEYAGFVTAFRLPVDVGSAYQCAGCVRTARRAVFAVRPARVESRLAALEQRPGPKYLGPWKELPADGAGYTEGDVVTKDGNLWICRLNQQWKAETLAELRVAFAKVLGVE